jgi:hypothetical protein
MLGLPALFGYLWAIPSYFGLLADIAIGGGWGLGQLAIAIVIFAAVCAIVYVALNKFGIAIPGWFVAIVWIVIAAVVACIAIKFLITLF